MNDAPLVEALQNSSFDALVILMSKLLSRIGLGDVEILDRRKVSQRSRNGGHELVCHAMLGSFPVTIVVKLIRDDIRVRMLDELAGTVQRTKADFGLIVSPFTITANAAKQQGLHSSRIDVVDGSGLARLMRKAKLGIRQHGEPDYAFFGGLEDAAMRVNDFIATWP